MAPHSCSHQKFYAFLLLVLTITSCSQKQFAFRKTVKATGEVTATTQEKQTVQATIELKNTLLPIHSTHKKDSVIVYTYTKKPIAITSAKEITHQTPQLNKKRIIPIIITAPKNSAQPLKSASKFGDLLGKIYVFTALILASTIFLLSGPGPYDDNFKHVIYTLSLIGVAMLAVIILPALLFIYLKK